jgi:hypothetical protein
VAVLNIWLLAAVAVAVEMAVAVEALVDFAPEALLSLLLLTPSQLAMVALVVLAETEEHKVPALFLTRLQVLAVAAAVAEMAAKALADQADQAVVVVA